MALLALGSNSTATTFRQREALQSADTAADRGKLPRADSDMGSDELLADRAQIAGTAAEISADWDTKPAAETSDSKLPAAVSESSANASKQRAALRSADRAADRDTLPQADSDQGSNIHSAG